MRLVAPLRRPVTGPLDTSGPHPGPGAEDGGIAGEFRASMALLSDQPAPTVANIMGQGR
jgi:acetyl-CoA carboxylase alpha subunit